MPESGNASLLAVGARRRRHSAAAAAFLLLFASGGPVAAQGIILPRQEPPSFDLMTACPPGHRVAFVLGTTSLFIDLRWLDTFTLAALTKQARERCPSEPVRSFDWVTFNQAAREAIAPPDGLGDPFFFLVIHDGATVRRGTENARRAPPPVPPPPRSAASRSWIEDITQPSGGGKDFGPGKRHPNTRVYQLHYPGGIGDAPGGTVRVSCGEAGHPAGRTCGTAIAYFYAGGDLGVRYEYRQDRLPIPELLPEPTADPTGEPGAVLVFDIRLRAWIDRLQQRP